MLEKVRKSGIYEGKGYRFTDDLNLPKQLN